MVCFESFGQHSGLLLIFEMICDALQLHLEEKEVCQVTHKESPGGGACNWDLSSSAPFRLLSQHNYLQCSLSLSKYSHWTINNTAILVTTDTRHYRHVSNSLVIYKIGEALWVEANMKVTQLSYPSSLSSVYVLVTQPCLAQSLAYSRTSTNGQTNG